MKTRLAILGSTGSIGQSTLRVVRHHRDRFDVIALAARGTQAERLLAQIEEFAPQRVAVADRTVARELSSQVGSGVEILGGEEAACEVVVDDRVDRVVAAMVGAAGLLPTAAALEAGKDVALANKEALVVGGPLLMALAESKGCRLLPVDSEPVALDQGLRCGRRAEVERLILTASGGPFLERDLDTWDRITPQEALAHPTWSMGKKISIDSATLMNKGLELIEASYLFGVEESQIEVVIHPQSLVHSIVEYCDGSCLAQLSPNDMAVPIQYALTFPQRCRRLVDRLALAEIGQLQFRPVDSQRYPSLQLAREALRAGSSAPAVLSAANEVAVQAFLEGRIPFVSIAKGLEQVLAEHRAVDVGSLDEALEWDRWGRRRALEILG